MQGKVLATLDKEEKLEILGGGYRDQKIGASVSRWLKVHWRGQIGWMFGAFIYSPYFDEV